MTTNRSLRRQLLGDAPHLFERGAAPGLGRGHYRALDDWRVADHHLALPLVAEHLDRHLAVRLRPAEIDQYGDTLVRPGVVDRLQNLRHIGAEPAIGIAAAEAEWHVLAHHLAHHVGSAFRHIGRMRDDDDAYLIFNRHFLSSMWRLSFPLAGKVATPALSRGSRMGVPRAYMSDHTRPRRSTPTPALRADPPRNATGREY